MRRKSKVRASPAAIYSSPDGRVHLTERQLQIALLVADGWSTKEIASRLDLTTRTVDAHRNNIYKAVGVNSAVQLVRYLIREGLLEP
jgi:DNA-binding NarL/FixJ family response regulator